MRNRKPNSIRQLKLRNVAVEYLKPAPYNPRIDLQPGTPGYEKLRRSLTEFDLVQPLVWNERTGHVVSGHQRLAILKAEGVESLDVVVVDLPLEREQALNVTLNNARVGGDWETDKLISLLDELQELPDFDATLTGFSFDEMQSLLLAPDPEFDPDEQNATLDTFRVTLEIASENWEHFRPAFDRFIKKHKLTPHIQPPR